jgi:hypothetical protein
MDDMNKMLQKTAAANDVSQLLGEIFDSSIETLKADFPNQVEPMGTADFPVELEKHLYGVLDELMELVEALPEGEGQTISDDDGAWTLFGILLSGIISNQNGHRLSELDVELHDQPSERAVAKILNKTWCLDDGPELLERVHSIMDDDYAGRFARYSGASSAETLFDASMDEEDRSSESRAWRFAKHYKEQFQPDFFAGWDAGRAAMLLRWGAYLGWITRKEANDELTGIARKTAKKLHSWRAFAQSYLAGALLFKLICEEPDAEEYLRAIADSTQELLRGDKEDGIGQWKDFAWPLV